MRAAFFLASVASAADKVSWDEAKCVMEGKSIVRIRDFERFNGRFPEIDFVADEPKPHAPRAGVHGGLRLARLLLRLQQARAPRPGPSARAAVEPSDARAARRFVDTGKTYKVDGNYEKMGEKGDYDEDSVWTDWKRFSGVKESHRVYFKKDFDDIDATSEFWFLQKAWFDDDDTKRENVADIAGDVAKADIAVINSGWWDLKEDDDADRYCGRNFGKDDCEKDYKASLEKLVDNILSKVDVPLFREISCCGEDDKGWIDAIEDANDVIHDVMGDAGVGVVEVYDNYGYKDLDDYTTDGKHADPDECLRWFDDVFRMADAKQGTGCFGDAPAPAPRPTRACPERLRAAVASECPADVAALETCDAEGLGDGDACEADGECGTDKKLNNCPDGTGGTEADVYVLGDAPAPTTAPTPEPVPEVPVPAPEPVPEVPVPAPEPAPTPDNPIIIYDDPDESDGASAHAVAAALAAAGLALLA